MIKTLAIDVMALSVALLYHHDVYADDTRTLTTIVDASIGVTQIHLHAPEKSPGDMLVFDEPLLDTSGKNIGSNSGFCVCTLPDQFSECVWTLTLSDGSITVAGREAANGASYIPISGGTGAYAGAKGVMASSPSGNQTYTQVLTFNTSSP